jgi:putative copper resistance protein D
MWSRSIRTGQKATSPLRINLERAAVETLLIVIRFVHFVAVMTLFGSSLFPYYALQRKETDGGGRDEIAAFVQSVALYASLAALISAAGWLGCEAVQMSGDANGYRESGTILTVLNGTQFGRIWGWRLVLLAVMPIFFGYRILRHRAPLIWPALVSGMLLVGSLAGVGHGTMGTGFGMWVHLGNQAIHLLAAAAWVGGLLSLFHIIRSVRQSALRVEVLTHALERFSSVGLDAVLILLATGSLNSFFLVGRINLFLHTTYGHVLMIKLLLFLCMIALALFNRLVVMPRLALKAHAEESLRLLLRSVAIEQLLAVLVVATVSVLGMLPPAFDMHGTM